MTHRERIIIGPDAPLTVPSRLDQPLGEVDPGRLGVPEAGELGRLSPETSAADIRTEARGMVNRVVETLDDETLGADERNAMLDSVAGKLIPGEHEGRHYLSALHPQGERPFVMQNHNAARVAAALQEREQQKAAEAAQAKSEQAAALDAEAAQKLARTAAARQVISEVAQPTAPVRGRIHIADASPDPQVTGTPRPTEAAVEPQWPTNEPDAVTPMPKPPHEKQPAQIAPLEQPVAARVHPAPTSSPRPSTEQSTESIPKPDSTNTKIINSLTSEQVLTILPDNVTIREFAKQKGLTNSEHKLLEKRIYVEQAADMQRSYLGLNSIGIYSPEAMVTFAHAALEAGYMDDEHSRLAQIISHIHMTASEQIKLDEQRVEAARTAAQPPQPLQQKPINGAEEAGSPADGKTQLLPRRQPAPQDPPTDQFPKVAPPESPAEITQQIPVVKAETVAEPGSYVTNYYAPMHYEGGVPAILELKHRLQAEYDAQMEKQGGVKAHKALKNLIESFDENSTVEQKGTAIENLLNGLTFTGLSLEQAQKAKGRLLKLGEIHGLTMDQRIQVGFKIASAQDAINFYVGPPTPNSPREERSPTYLQAYEHFVNGARGFYKPSASDKATGMHKFDQEDLDLIRGPLAGDYKALGLIVELPKDRISNKVRKEATRLLSRHFANIGSEGSDAMARGVEETRDRRERLLAEEDFSNILNNPSVSSDTKRLVLNAKLLLETRRYNEFTGNNPFGGMTKKAAKAQLKIIQKREKELITGLIAAGQKDVVARFRANIPYTNKSYLYNDSLAQDLPHLAGLPNKTKQQITEEAAYARAHPVQMEPNDIRAVGAGHRNPRGVRNMLRSVFGFQPKAPKDKFGR